MRYEPPAGSRPAHTRTQPPFHFCPGAFYARLVEELRPLTYGLVGHKTKLTPKDQWSTILVINNGSHLAILVHQGSDPTPPYQALVIRQSATL